MNKYENKAKGYETKPNGIVEDNLRNAVRLYLTLREIALNNMQRSEFTNEFNKGLVSIVAKNYDVKEEDILKTNLDKVPCVLSENIQYPHKTGRENACEGSL